MDSYTIGFTGKSAEKFFSLLRGSSANHLIDVRLQNVSQLAGFAKKQDLAFFVREILHWNYSHIPDLAPTKEMLDAYKKHHDEWKSYRENFLELMDKRSIERSIDRAQVENACLLCSEHLPHHCHRTLVLEYLNSKWETKLSIKHLF